MWRHGGNQLRISVTRKTQNCLSEGASKFLDCIFVLRHFGTSFQTAEVRIPFQSTISHHNVHPKRNRQIKTVTKEHTCSLQFFPLFK